MDEPSPLEKSVVKLYPWNGTYTTQVIHNHDQDGCETPGTKDVLKVSPGRSNQCNADN